MRVILLLFILFTLCSFTPKHKKVKKSKKTQYHFSDSCNKVYTIVNQFNRNFTKPIITNKINIDSFFKETINTNCFQTLNEKEIKYLFGKPKNIAYNSLRINIPKQIIDYDSIYIYTFSKSYRSNNYYQLFFKFKQGQMKSAYYIGDLPNREDERQMPPDPIEK